MYGYVVLRRDAVVRVICEWLSVGDSACLLHVSCAANGQSWGHQETRPEAEQTYSMVDGWYSNPWFHPCNGIFQPASLLFDA